MSRKQLLALFICSLVIWTGCNGITPLLPVYFGKLGAPPALTGYALALTFVGVTAGTLGGGWLADRFRRRKALLIGAGAAFVPATWLTGMVVSVWQLAVLTTIIGFVAGMCIVEINILAGLFAGEKERGRVFGLLGLNWALGSLLGGISTGVIADRLGYPTMFAAVGLFFVLIPLCGLLLQDRPATQPPRGNVEARGSLPHLPVPFFLLLGATLGVYAAYTSGNLGRSLAMNAQGFNATAIAASWAVAGAFILPFPLVLGLLSDRFGRRGPLIVCYLSCAASLALLVVATSLWHFYLSAGLWALVAAGRGTASALATDLLPPETLGRGLSGLDASGWIGNTLGYAVTGTALQALGQGTTFGVFAFLPLLAVALLIPVRRVRRVRMAESVSS